MREELCVTIYGDSLMKGTVIDENCRYRAVMQDSIRDFSSQFDVRVENRSRFGITVEKGLSMLSRDIQEGLNCDYALVEFGGNDCNFRWNEVSASPEGEHEPLTGLPRFKETLNSMLSSLRSLSITPILMTLPPIDAEKYLRFVSRGGNDIKRILKWLGDTQMIYRYHELYSRTVSEIAHKSSTLLIDVREYFLKRRNYTRLIGLDGIHLSPEGYALLYEAIRDFAVTLKSRRLDIMTAMG